MLTTFRRAAVLAAVGLTTCTPAAFAGTDEKITVKGGWVKFDHHGEHLYAADTSRAHKYGVRAYLDWKDKKGKLHTVFTTSYNNGRIAHRNLSFPEGKVVTLMVCYVDRKGNSRQCSLGQKATA